MNLSGLRPPAGQKKNRKRVGHGMGSGHGKTSGARPQGAHAVTGYSQMRGFEGGQMPLHRRLPKRGFTNIFQEAVSPSSISDGWKSSRAIPSISTA